MSDSSDGAPDGSRMQLTPDTLHEEEDGIYLDCPQCGSPVSVPQIVSEGRCTGVLEADEAETVDDEVQLDDSGCGAKLSLELVWEA